MGFEGGHVLSWLFNMGEILKLYVDVGVPASSQPNTGWFPPPLRSQTCASRNRGIASIFVGRVMPMQPRSAFVRPEISSQTTILLRSDCGLLVVVNLLGQKRSRWTSAAEHPLPARLNDQQPSWSTCSGVEIAPWETCRPQHNFRRNSSRLHGPSPGTHRPHHGHAPRS